MSPHIAVSRETTHPRIGSLCSGYGGLDLGLMAVIGGSVAWHVEYDKHPSAVLDARFPGVPNYGDLTTTDWTQVEPVDWLTAGYPCQPFSHAGKRKGSADERHLWPFVADAIGALRPRRVLLENVAGHVSLGLDAVLWDLAALGYDATWGVVRAADAGAPHGRARLFIVADDADRVRREHGDRRQPRGTTALAGATAPDASGERHGSGQDGRSLGRVDGTDAGEARQRERPRPVASDRSSTAPADAGGGPLAGPAATRDGLRLVAECGGRAPADTDGAGLCGLTGLPAERGAVHGHGRSDADGRGAVVEWGAYRPAIARWEAVIGRPAPRPTEPGRTGERLSPRFVEWMMGLPDGWVTAVLSRNPALKALGNGVVPQQAALAITAITSSAEAVA